MRGWIGNLTALALVWVGAGTSAAQQNAAPPATSPAAATIPGEAGSTVDTHAFGVLPNYRTVEAAQPFARLTTKQKFTIATKDTFDGPSFGLATIFSSLSQLTNDNPSFGQGVKGFAHRFALANVDQDLGNYLTEGILPWMLKEDPRYFRKGTGGKWARIGYAVTRVLIAHGDNGALRFNTSEILGNGIVASIANTYYPDNRGFSSTMQRMGKQVGTDAISSVLKEFWPDVKEYRHRRAEKRAAGL